MPVKVPKKLDGKRVFVAGGTGLVGSNLAKHLVNIGALVSASCFSKQPSESYLKRFDFTDREQCVEATKDMDYVFICAAQTYGAHVMKEAPTLLIDSNLSINANLLSACFQNKVKKTLFVSSSTVYQEAYFPIREDELNLNLPPYSLYMGVGWMKRYIEQLARFYNQRYGMNVNIVRPTNIYGPGDKFEEGKSHVIPALIKRALDGEDPFVVWGTGNAVRDFIYVDDFVNDILKVFISYDSIEPLNICSGDKLSIREAVKVIIAECGANPKEIIYDTMKPDAIPYRQLSNEKFKALFGVPERTSFPEGIRSTIKYYTGIPKS